MAVWVTLVTIRVCQEYAVVAVSSFLSWGQKRKCLIIFTYLDVKMDCLMLKSCSFVSVRI
jgi:hypothetical protein